MTTLIVGLGNPGKNYEKTIHNMGFMVVDHFASHMGLKFSKNKFDGTIAEGVLDGNKFILLKPETFMNLSGKSVLEAVSMLKLDTTNVLVIFDDIDINFADIRLRLKGSGGTHNGVRDIVAKIGENFPRVRMGVGRPVDMDLTSFVLSKISDENLNILENNFEKTDKIIEYFILKHTLEGLDVTRL